MVLSEELAAALGSAGKCVCVTRGLHGLPVLAKLDNAAVGEREATRLDSAAARSSSAAESVALGAPSNQ